MVEVPALISTDILWGSFHETIVQGTKDLWSLMRRRQATSAGTGRDQSIILMDTACLLTTSPPQPISPSAGAGAKYQQEATLYCWITTFRATACKSILSWKMEKETSSLLILVKMVKRYLSRLICFLGAIEWGMIDTYKDNAPYPKIDVTKKSFIWAKHRLVCLHY